MNKIVISLFLLLIMSEQHIHAQTYYYKFVKSIIQGKVDISVKGGQFVTFDRQKCYESDKNGNEVGNGVMAYDTEVSKQTHLETYWGSCYWSKNAYMKFNVDKSVMNIETNAGKIYVYKRATPPAGVTTSSLIRKSKPSSGGGSGDGTTIVVEQHGPVQVWVPCGACGHNPGVCQTCVGMGTSASGRTCISCHGTGKCHFCNGKGGHYQVQYR